MKTHKDADGTNIIDYYMDSVLDTPVGKRPDGGLTEFTLYTDFYYQEIK
ncbi:MAG: hypothetical protein J6N81_10525 [Treponema sp.]|nr:hypothetical protein [Treponema sp.]